MTRNDAIKTANDIYMFVVPSMLILHCIYSLLIYPLFVWFCDRKKLIMIHPISVKLL